VDTRGSDDQDALTGAHDRVPAECPHPGTACPSCPSCPDSARLDALVRHTADALMVVDPDGSVTYGNPAAEALLGSSPVGWDTAGLIDRIHPDERRATVAAIKDRLETSAGQTIRTHARLIGGDGRDVLADVVVEDLRDDTGVRGLVLTVTETTRTSQLEAELRHLAFHDPLTGLGNREVFRDRLGQALRRAARTGARVAVLLCDLDDFKDVNDTLGHAAGDQLLCELADRLEEVTRGTDTVARLGGDEFAIVCEDVAATRDAIGAARRVLTATERPVVVDDHELSIGLSIGVAVDGGERSVEELLRDADVALYDAKERGKRRWSLHRPAMTLLTQARRELATDLARVVELGRIGAAYQPIVSLADRHVVGVEALARWEHPSRGPVPPSEFIPVAESNGLISQLGDAVLDQALATRAEWLAARPEIAINVGGNLSARQLRDPQLADRIEVMLRRHGLPGDRVVLELTESVTLEDVDRVVAVMEQVRSLGIRFAVDDFGTGYSSLSYLRRLPVDIVKVDRSFVADVTCSSAARDLVQAIIDLARALHLDVVAEGVETDEQCRQLQLMGCGYAQGYWFARPMDRAALLGYLTAPTTRVRTDVEVVTEDPPRHHRAAI
jgi:diguanylate cyclase (GGDEF)-like protein/PAS domain S-box-containing protein